MTNPGNSEKTQEELFEDRNFQEKIQNSKGNYPIQLLKALIEILKPWKKGKRKSSMTGSTL